MANKHTTILSPHISCFLEDMVGRLESWRTNQLHALSAETTGFMAGERICSMGALYNILNVVLQSGVL